MAESNRRDFFRRAATEAVRGAREVIPLVEPLATLAEGSSGATQAPAPAAVQGETGRTEPATPTSRAASVEEMLAIAAEVGLGARAEDLRRLAVRSTRLRPGLDDDGASGSSFAGGEPPVPAAVEVPEFDGGPPEFVARLAVPTGGRLWVFRSGAEVSAVLEPEGDPAVDAPAPHPPGAIPLASSDELTLPRPWSAAVEPLALSRREQDSWQELRTRLAASQGVPLGESAPAHAAIHRLGGYPDERRGEMPLICELRLLGVDLEGQPPATHPLAGALAGECGNWRLLAQLGADDDLGWSWGSGHGRAYVWGQVEDPASGEYASVQVVIQ